MRALQVRAEKIGPFQKLTSNKDFLAYQNAGLLEVIKPRFGFESVGGNKLIVHRLKSICSALKTTDRLVRQSIPMGILFLGPPGTGKTLVAEAFAKECGVHCIKLGNIREKWVGQSERNLSAVLALITTMEPVIIIVDEIDQFVGSRNPSEDSGVSRRIFAKLVGFMGDTSLRGRVLWIATSNSPELIDPAMKRSGRFDLKLPFFLPEREDRKHIFQVILQSKEIPYDPVNVDFDFLADNTEYFSGADIEMIVNEALRAAIIKCRGKQDVRLKTEDFISIFNSFRLGKDPKVLEIIEKRILQEIPLTEFWPQRYLSE